MCVFVDVYCFSIEHSDSIRASLSRNLGHSLECREKSEKRREKNNGKKEEMGNEEKERTEKEEKTHE